MIKKDKTNKNHINDIYNVKDQIYKFIFIKKNNIHTTIERLKKQ